MYIVCSTLSCLIYLEIAAKYFYGSTKLLSKDQMGVCRCSMWVNMPTGRGKSLSLQTAYTNTTWNMKSIHIVAPYPNRSFSKYEPENRQNTLYVFL